MKAARCSFRCPASEATDYARRAALKREAQRRYQRMQPFQYGAMVLLVLVLWLLKLTH